MIRRLGSTRSIHSASGNSRPLRMKLRPGHRNRFLAVCWVMVEPPLASVMSSASSMRRLKLGPVDAVMGAKPAVLGRDDGARQHRRDPFQRNDRALDPLAGHPAGQHQGRHRIDHAVQRRQQIGQQQDGQHRHDQPADHTKGRFASRTRACHCRRVKHNSSHVRPNVAHGRQNRNRLGRLVCRTAQRRRGRDRATAGPAARPRLRPRARSRGRSASSRPCAIRASAAASGCGRS